MVSGNFSLDNYSKLRPSAINVLALVKGAERYIFLFKDEYRSKTLRILGRYASDPNLSFSWYDAAVLSQKIRQKSQKLEENLNRFDI